MYPDWPKSSADLVPLPQCEGPKLKAFDFQGPQKIEFLEHLGEGAHSHVLKVKILGQIYALKLFRFIEDDQWMAPEDEAQALNLEAMTYFANYGEPFNCECRAFGRLQEAGYEELAVKCYGYVLLDEEHERALHEQIVNYQGKPLEFSEYDRRRLPERMRSRFVGKEGRVPPIRGIVKEFGQPEEVLRVSHVRKLFRDVVRFQQLGIVQLDSSHRQIIDGKLCDLSCAYTVPHFLLNTEMNPHLTPDWIYRMDRLAFEFCRQDYWDLDEMILTWNYDTYENGHKKLSFCAFPGGDGCNIVHNLRSSPSRDRAYTYLDPRRYDWRKSAARAANAATGALEGQISSRITNGSSHEAHEGVISKRRQRLDARPPRWYLDCSPDESARLAKHSTLVIDLVFEFKDGYPFPKATWHCHL